MGVEFQEEKTAGRDASIDHVRFLMIRELWRLDYNVKLTDKLTAMHDEIMGGDFSRTKI